MKDWEEEADRMVKEQILRRGVSNTRVLEALRHVPRHLFVPADLRSSAYTDQPLPIGQGQTISQPYIVAYMTGCLDAKPRDRILEIGTGSGYQAAILAEMGCEVFTIEIRQLHAERARKIIQRLGYANIHFKVGNGVEGWRDESPFDGVMVTAASTEVPKQLVEQLCLGGRMVIPLGGSLFAQELVLIEKLRNREVASRTLMGVRFVPLVEKNN